MSEAVYEHLRRYAEYLNVPPGRGGVEISDGQIIMMLSPSRRHALAARRLRRELETQLPGTHPGFVPENGPEIEDPRLGVLRRPDLVVVREEALDEECGGVFPADVLLAAEIVSPSNPETGPSTPASSPSTARGSGRARRPVRFSRWGHG